MKRTLSLLLLSALVVGLAAPALAWGPGGHGGHRGYGGRGGYGGPAWVGPVIVGELMLGMLGTAAIMANRPERIVVVPPAGPPVYYPQVQAYAQPAPVCYPHGCYHLTGDGVYTPFRWVWVPTPNLYPPLPPPPPAQ